MPSAETNINRIAELIRAHQLGELDDYAKKELNEWRFENPENELLFNNLNNPGFLNRNLGELTKFNAETSFAKFKAKHFKAEKLPLSSKYVLVKLKYFVGIAAVLALVMISAFFFDNYRRASKAQQLTNKTDAAPGKFGATLTLGNGKQIRLSDAKNGELLKESGITISKSADGQLIYELTAVKGNESQLNTLSTAKGETYKLRLPDGSQIWLNAASSLTYTANLVRNNKRVVRLDGEAYLEVAKDKKHPFIVESNGQLVEVLGTHFNINAYKDEPQTATTLLEGSVKVQFKGQTKHIKPGQQALNEGNTLRVNEVNVEDITDWKEGDFFLNHVDFKTAMRKIARWYDVEIVYDTAVPEDLEYGGWMSRRNNLSTVLKAIEGTGLAKFKIEGNKVHVYK